MGESADTMDEINGVKVVCQLNKDTSCVIQFDTAKEVTAALLYIKKELENE